LSYTRLNRRRTGADEPNLTLSALPAHRCAHRQFASSASPSPANCYRFVC